MTKKCRGINDHVSDHAALLVINLLFYSMPLTVHIIAVLVLVSLLATVVEGLTPKGLDNLTVPLLASFACWYLTTGI